MTRREPILAWRIWRLRTHDDGRVVEPVLESCVYGDEWPALRPFVAECPEHALPTPSCGCGLYAVSSRDQALEWARWAQSAVPQPIVLGRVQLWGRVLPYSTGYRAQLAYPYDLEVLPGDGVGEAHARRLQRSLRARYLVDGLARAA